MLPDCYSGCVRWVRAASRRAERTLRHRISLNTGYIQSIMAPTHLHHAPVHPAPAGTSFYARVVGPAARRTRLAPPFCLLLLLLSLLSFVSKLSILFLKCVASTTRYAAIPRRNTRQCIRYMFPSCLAPKKRGKSRITPLGKNRLRPNN